MQTFLRRLKQRSNKGLLYGSKPNDKCLAKCLVSFTSKCKNMTLKS